MARRDGVTRTEWMVEVDMGDGFKPSPHPRAPFVTLDEAQARAYMRGIIKPKRLMSRTVHTGPWRPA